MVSLSLGPIIGGLFSSLVNWRWVSWTSVYIFFFSWTHTRLDILVHFNRRRNPIGIIRLPLSSAKIRIPEYLFASRNSSTSGSLGNSILHCGSDPLGFQLDIRKPVWLEQRDDFGAPDYRSGPSGCFCCSGDQGVNIPPCPQKSTV